MRPKASSPKLNSNLHPEVSGHVQAAIIPSVYDFFDLADALLRQQESRTRLK